MLWLSIRKIAFTFWEVGLILPQRGKAGTCTGGENLFCCLDSTVDSFHVLADVAAEPRCFPSSTSTVVVLTTKLGWSFVYTTILYSMQLFSCLSVNVCICSTLLCRQLHVTFKGLTATSQRQLLLSGILTHTHTRTQTDFNRHQSELALSTFWPSFRS